MHATSQALFSGAAPQVCQLCKEAVASDSIASHVERHVEQTKCQAYACGHCATVVYSEEAVLEHIADEHGDKAFEFTAPTIAYEAVRQVRAFCQVCRKLCR